MDENRNPFDSTQSNSNPSEPQQTGSHTTPSTEWPQQGASGQSEGVYYQSGQEYRNTEQNQQERSSDIPDSFGAAALRRLFAVYARGQF